MVAPGAALLSPRGKVLEHGMPRFFRRLAEGVFDEEECGCNHSYRDVASIWGGFLPDLAPR
jgi:predicted esterase